MIAKMISTVHNMTRSIPAETVTEATMNRLYRIWLRYMTRWDLRSTERDLNAAQQRDQDAMTNREWVTHLKYVGMLDAECRRLRAQLEALE